MKFMLLRITVVFTAPMSHYHEPNRGLNTATLNTILHHTPLPVISTLMLCNQQWRITCRAYLERKQSSLFRCYLDDGSAFRSLLLQSGSVISGLDAVDFALHGTTLPSLFPIALNLYTDSMHAAMIICHLRDIEDYCVQAKVPEVDETYLEGIEHGRAETIVLAHTGKQTRIDVSCGSQLDSSFAIAYSPCTLGFCHMTANEIVVPYPTFSFNGVALRSTIREDNERDVQGEYYMKRGFMVADFADVYVRTLPLLR